MGLAFSVHNISLEIDETDPIQTGKQICGKVVTFASAAFKKAQLQVEVFGELCATFIDKKSNNLSIQKKQLIKSKQVLVPKGVRFQIGKQEHKFTFSLPEGLPPSLDYQGENGESLKVRYFVRAKLQMPSWFVKQVKDIVVAAPTPELNEQQLKQQRQNHKILVSPSRNYHKFPVEAQLDSEKVHYGDSVKIFVDIHNYPYKVYPKILVNFLEKSTIRLGNQQKLLERRYFYELFPEVMKSNKPLQLDYHVQVQGKLQDQSFHSDLISLEHFVELQLLNNSSNETASLKGNIIRLPIVVLQQNQIKQ